MSRRLVSVGDDFKLPDEILAALGARVFLTSDPTAARPATSQPVIWFCPTEPDHMAEGDAYVPIATLS